MTRIRMGHLAPTTMRRRDGKRTHRVALVARSRATTDRRRAVVRAPQPLELHPDKQRDQRLTIYEKMHDLSRGVALETLRVPTAPRTTEGPPRHGRRRTARCHRR